MRRRAVWAGVVLLLAACGGGGGTSDAGSVAYSDVPWTGEIPEARQELPVDRVTVRVDPRGIAPLSALVEVAGPFPAPVRAVGFVLEEPGGTELAHAEDVRDLAARYALDDLVDGDAVGIPILGLFPDRDNPVRIEVITDDAVLYRDVVVATDPLDLFLPDVEVVAADPDRMEPGFNLAGYSANSGQFRIRPFLYDVQGRIRWVMDAADAVGPGFVTPVEPLADGNLVMGVGNTVYEFDRLGGERNRWLLPDGYTQHHDVFEMASGNLLVVAVKAGCTIIDGTGAEVTGGSDHVLEIDRNTGEAVNVWDLRAFLDVDRYSLFNKAGNIDWFHANAVVHDPVEDVIIVSGKHQGVACISRGGEAGDTPNLGKELRWILAPHRGWEQAGWDGSGMDLAPYLLTAVDADGTPWPDAIQDGGTATDAFEWPYAQHASMLLDGGHVFLFDNGSNRQFGADVGDPYSRGVEYRVTPASSGVGGTVTQVWQYGKERGPQLYAPVISDVDAGPVTGNRFVLPGSYTLGTDGTPGGTARMVEVTGPDREVVFEAHLHMEGKDAWGDDICYRQERMALFPGE